MEITLTKNGNKKGQKDHPSQSDACAMFFATSFVAADCSSMAAAIEATIALTSRMTSATLPISEIPPAVAD